MVWNCSSCFFLNTSGYHNGDELKSTFGIVLFNQNGSLSGRPFKKKIYIFMALQKVLDC